MIRSLSRWKAVRTGQVIISEDTANDPRIVLREMSDEGIRAMALAPMHARNRAVGVLSVMSYHTHRFSQQDQQLLAAVADRVGLALDNARLYTRIQRRLQAQSALHEEQSSPSPQFPSPQYPVSPVPPGRGCSTSASG